MTALSTRYPIFSLTEESLSAMSSTMTMDEGQDSRRRALQTLPPPQYPSISPTTTTRSLSPSLSPLNPARNQPRTQVDLALQRVISPVSPLRQAVHLPATSPETSMAHSARSSVSSVAPSGSRSRRQSSLVHEIQPPRRLSAHQILLLTPFGLAPSSMTNSPPALPASAGMASERTFGNLWLDSAPMGRSPSSTGAGMSREASSSGHLPAPFPNSTTAPSMPVANYNFPPNSVRTRHASLVGTIGPSPLSRPLAPIPSRSEHGSSEGYMSRQVSDDPSDPGLEPDDDGLSLAFAQAAILPSTVPMTRSNSVPVLSLAELEHLKARDAELGISRGQEFAWVSRVADEASPELETPVATSSGSFTTPTASSSSFTPPPQRPPLAPSFSDPFASGDALLPSATSPSYRYMPLPEDRRASDAAASSMYSDSPRDSPRPSAPLSNPRGSIHTPRVRTAPITEESPRGTNATVQASPGSSRPSLKRYRTSPARFTGLGLDIVVQTGGGNPAGTSPGSRRTSLAPSDGAPHAPVARRLPGSWAAIDAVQPIELAARAARESVSSGSATAGSHESASTSSGLNSAGSTTSARGTIPTSPRRPNPVMTIAVATRAMVTGKRGESSRARFESVDSSIPFFPSGVTRFIAQRTSDPSPASDRRESHTGVASASGDGRRGGKSSGLSSGEEEVPRGGRFGPFWRRGSLAVLGTGQAAVVEWTPDYSAESAAYRSRGGSE